MDTKEYVHIILHLLSDQKTYTYAKNKNECYPTISQKQVKLPKTSITFYIAQME